jgi:hypothetical protein
MPSLQKFYMALRRFALMDEATPQFYSEVSDIPDFATVF